MVFKRGNIPWNKGKHTGQITWMKGKKHTEESKKKMRESHKGQVPWNKGKKTGSFLSEEQRKKQALRLRGETNPFYGRKHTEESRRKISDALMGRTVWNKGKKCPKTSKTLMGHTVSEETREKLRKARLRQPDPRLGKRHSEESKRKMSEAHKGKTQKSPKKGRSNIELYGIKRAKEISEKLRRARLKQVLPKKDTSIEVALQEELNRRNIKYETHLPVCGVCQPDIVFPDKKIAVFADGDYWHNLPNYKIRDKNQNKMLRRNGWAVLRFWQHKIESNVGECIDEVEGVLGCPVGY